jgi:hypothetical protein
MNTSRSKGDRLPCDAKVIRWLCAGVGITTAREVIPEGLVLKGGLSLDEVRLPEFSGPHLSPCKCCTKDPTNSHPVIYAIAEVSKLTAVKAVADEQPPARWINQGWVEADPTVCKRREPTPQDPPALHPIEDSDQYPNSAWNRVHVLLKFTTSRARPPDFSEADPFNGESPRSIRNELRVLLAAILTEGVPDAPSIDEDGEVPTPPSSPPPQH